MKKKADIPTATVSSTEVAMAHPEVRSNINMNLSQDDLIQMAIQTQLEISEKEMERVEQLLLINQQRCETLKKDLVPKIQTILLKEEEYKKFMSICKAAGIKEDQITSSFCGVANHRCDSNEVRWESEPYKYMDLNNIERNYKDPLTGI